VRIAVGAKIGHAQALAPNVQRYTELIPTKAACHCGGNILRDGSRRPWKQEKPMAESSTHHRKSLSNRRLTAALALALGAGLALPQPLWADSPPEAAAVLVPQQSLAPLVKKVLPAVVNISVTQKSSEQTTQEMPFQNFPGSPFDDLMRRFFEQQGEGGQRHVFPGTPGGQMKGVALGSGFIIDPEGHVVTNNHVVGDADKVEVTLQDNSKYTAKIIGHDAKTDLAVLKISAGKPLPYVTFGDSSAAQIGDWVMAVGNPFGLGGTVTTGIISARGRDIHSSAFDDFLQIDAPINRGNSGGPTFNLSGEVIGINTAIYSPNGGSVGIGFAVPSNTAKLIVAQLEEHGKVTRGWLGVQIQQVTQPIAASLGLNGERGALVAAVTPNSPGAQAGLRQGDVILSFNGHPIRELRDLPRLVAATEPNQTAALEVWREGQTIQLQSTVGELNDEHRVASAAGAEQQTDQAEALGVHFAPMSNELRGELHLAKGAHGVVVSDIDGGSAAEEAGLVAGDVVVAINQQPVHTPEEAAQKLQQAANSSNKNALLLVDRQGVTQYLGIRLGRNQG
jgi:serine protease Do